MLRTSLYYVAGIDRETVATCPATDKMWAAHLGLSLLLSFTVVLGITFHASGYVLAETWMRLFVATVVALTVFMFDRALYQSDWFYQGLLWPSPADRGYGSSGAPWPSLRRLCRIAIRLSISFGLAWVIAVFLELAVFSDTITDKIKRDHLVANESIFKKIEQYEAQLAGEIEQRRLRLAELEKLYGHELAPTAGMPQSSEYGPRQLALDQRIGELDVQEQGIYAALREVDTKIAGNVEAMNAEELGQRIGPDSSGRAGPGPRYQFARRQKEFNEARRAELQREIAQLGVRREELRGQQRQLLERSAALSDQSHDAARSRRDALSVQIESARVELRGLEASRFANIEDFRGKALAASDFRKLKDDPLSRMTAYQQLKNDPEDGETIILFSWMTKFLVIFLEIVPVVAKMFFSPPSVYAAKIQAQVEGERRKAMWEREQLLADWQPENETRPRDRETWINGEPWQGVPQPQARRVDRHSAVGTSPEDRETASDWRSGIVEPVQALDGQAAKEARTPDANAHVEPRAGRRETIATSDAGRAGLGGATSVGPTHQTRHFVDPESPRQSSQTGADGGKYAVLEQVAEAASENFDGVDPELTHDWDDLMEVAERGGFRPIHEDEDTFSIAGVAPRS
jgi:hypothetical protein